MRCSPLLLAIKPFLLDNHYPNRRPKGFCLFSTLDKIRFIHPPHLHMCTSDHLQWVFFPDANSAQMLMCFHTVLSTNMELLWWFKEGWVYFKSAALPARWDSHIYVSICPVRLLTSAGQTLQPSTNFKKRLRSFIGGSALRYSLCQWQKAWRGCSDSAAFTCRWTLPGNRSSRMWRRLDVK